MAIDIAGVDECFSDEEISLVDRICARLGTDRKGLLRKGFEQTNRFLRRVEGWLNESSWKDIGGWPWGKRPSPKTFFVMYGVTLQVLLSAIDVMRSSWFGEEFIPLNAYYVTAQYCSRSHVQREIILDDFRMVCFSICGNWMLPEVIKYCEQDRAALSEIDKHMDEIENILIKFLVMKMREVMGRKGVKDRGDVLLNMFEEFGEPHLNELNVGGQKEAVVLDLYGEGRLAERLLKSPIIKRTIQNAATSARVMSGRKGNQHIIQEDFFERGVAILSTNIAVKLACGKEISKGSRKGVPFRLIDVLWRLPFDILHDYQRDVGYKYKRKRGPGRRAQGERKSSSREAKTEFWRVAIEHKEMFDGGLRRLVKVAEDFVRSERKMPTVRELAPRVSKHYGTVSRWIAKIKERLRKEGFLGK